MSVLSSLSLPQGVQKGCNNPTLSNWGNAKGKLYASFDIIWNL